jgi:hypothetical protein
MGVFMMIVVTLITIYGIWLLRRFISHRHGPPVVGSFIPFLGCALSFRKEGPEFLKRIRKQYGDIVTLYMGGKDFTLVMGKNAHQLYQAGPQLDLKAAIRAMGMEPLFGQIERGFGFGNAIMPIFRAKLLPRIRESRKLIEDEIRFGIEECISRNADFNYEDIKRVIMGVNSRLLVGPTICRDRKFLDGLTEYLNIANILKNKRGDPGPLQRGIAVREELTKQILGVAKSYEEQCRSGDDNAPIAERSFLHDLLLAYFSDVAESSSRQRFPSIEFIASQVLGVLFPSLHNPPAVAMLTIASVLSDKKFTEKVTEEARALVNFADDVTTDEKIKMPFTNACMKEATRLFPQILNMRFSSAPVKFGQYTIPSNEFVFASPVVEHHDEKNYTNPLVYDPYRHLSTAEEVESMSYLTFGVCRHHCPGQPIALLEISTLIGYLFANYNIKMKNEFKWADLDWFAVGVPKLRGVALEIRPRQPTATTA